jgi:hypothetical protein
LAQKAQLFRHFSPGDKKSNQSENESDQQNGPNQASYRIVKGQSMTTIGPIISRTKKLDGNTLFTVKVYIVILPQEIQSTLIIRQVFMPARRQAARPAWVDLDEPPAPPPRPAQPRSQYVHPEDDPNYVPPPRPKGPSRGPAKPARRPAGRPDFDTSAAAAEADPKLYPVWAQEVVAIPGRRTRSVQDEMNDYVHPEDDPNYRGPPRPDFERSTIDAQWRGRQADRPDARMVWRCPDCLAEWSADEATRCPRCGGESPQATYGAMFPLIEAMQMIADGEDPRHGRVDAALDRLLDEQCEDALPRRAPPGRKPVSDGKRRVIVQDPTEPVTRKDPAAIYLEICQLTRADANAKCSLCKMPIRPAARNVRLGCGDLFHSNCITGYLRAHEDCPNCKQKAQ